MKQFALLDVCCPDYFTGYHRPVIAIPVMGPMTNTEMAEEIRNELDYCYDYWRSGHPVTSELLIDQFCAELLLNPDDQFINPGYEDTNDLDDFEFCAYAYFGVINPVYSNGIMFLNP